MTRKHAWMLLFFSPFLFSYTKIQKPLALPGLPLQLGWYDVNGDGLLDLQAMMLLTQVQGSMDTYFEEGDLRGFYEDETLKEKYFVTYLQTASGWEEAGQIELGQAQVLGFVTEESQPAILNIWSQQGLTRYRWEKTAWKPFAFGKTPGLLAHAPTSLSNFDFWHDGEDGSYWAVPDLAGIHLLQADKDFASTFLPYPTHTVDYNRVSSKYHSRSFQMPTFSNTDGKEGPELLFTGGGRATAFPLGKTKSIASVPIEGNLVDMDGDGLADRIVVKEDDDIERLKDLPKVKSNVSVYRATGPLVFEKEPLANQDLAGFLIQDNDSEIQLAPPYSDFNNDGRTDLVGIAIKLGVWQIAKLVSLGRLKIKFHLHMHVQKEDGSFRTLANGPYLMTWKINIRKLKLPELAQIAADYNGDGWHDILKVGDSNLEITPVTEQGFQKQSIHKIKIPRQYRKADQAYGRDLNSDGKAEIILVKLDNNQTRLGLLEVKP